MNNSFNMNPNDSRFPHFFEEKPHNPDHERDNNVDINTNIGHQNPNPNSIPIQEYSHDHDQNYEYDYLLVSCNLCNRERVSLSQKRRTCRHVVCNSCSSCYNPNTCPACCMIKLHEKEVMRILSRNVKTNYSSIIYGLDDDDCESELVFIKDERKGLYNHEDEDIQRKIHNNSLISTVSSFSNAVLSLFILTLVVILFAEIHQE